MVKGWSILKLDQLDGNRVAGIEIVGPRLVFRGSLIDDEVRLLGQVDVLAQRPRAGVTMNCKQRVSGSSLARRIRVISEFGCDAPCVDLRQRSTRRKVQQGRCQSPMRVGK